MKPFPASPILLGILFAVAILATIGGALLAVFTQRIIRSVGGLCICCFGLAGLYYFLNSPFLALMEILIYVGAICVTIIFAVMLAEPDELPDREPPASRTIWATLALIMSFGLMAGLVLLVVQHPWAAPAARVNQGTVADIGKALLTTYGLAFELISLVLLVAILGALVVARYGRTKP